MKAKHGDFVTKYDVLNCQFTVFASAEAQQLKDSDKGEVEKR